MHNGYTDSTPVGLRRVGQLLRQRSAEQLDELRDAVRIGVHYNTQVTSAGAPLDQYVGQAFCSACSVGYSTTSDPVLWQPLGQLVLEAAYEATLWAAVLQYQRYCDMFPSREHTCRVYFTKLGAGVFGNPDQWVINALRRTLELAACAGLALDVKLVHFGSVDARYHGVGDRLPVFGSRPSSPSPRGASSRGSSPVRNGRRGGQQSPEPQSPPVQPDRKDVGGSSQLPPAAGSSRVVASPQDEGKCPSLAIPDDGTDDASQPSPASAIAGGTPQLSHRAETVRSVLTMSSTRQSEPRESDRLDGSGQGLPPLKQEKSKVEHLFPIDTNVEVFGLTRCSYLNGCRGVVKKLRDDGRVGVSLGPPHGTKALRPDNVRAVCVA